MIAEAIRRIEAAGFSVRVDGDALRVTPSSRLSAKQIEWLKRNKTAMVDHLKAIEVPHVREMVETFDAEVVSVVGESNER